MITIESYTIHFDTEITGPMNSSPVRCRRELANETAVKIFKETLRTQVKAEHPTAFEIQVYFTRKEK